MRFRPLALIPAAGLVLGAALAALSPQPVQAAKLPVDCSGKKSSCYERTMCTEWSNHVCRERTTEFWYWYY